MNTINSNLNTSNNSKIITVCIVAFSVLIGFTISILLKVFSGAFGLIAQAMSYDWFKHGLPVVVALAVFGYLQFNGGMLKWFEEVIAEVKKVVWPPVKDVRAMTIVVVVMVIISSIIISVFDLLSAFVLNQLIK